MNFVKGISALSIPRGYTSLKLVHARQTVAFTNATPVHKYRSVGHTDGKAAVSLTLVRHSHSGSSGSRKRPRSDRVGYQHEDKISEIKERFDGNFSTDEFFRGVAQTFVNVTNCICARNDEELGHMLSPGALLYAQWVRDESTHSDTSYNEVIFPTEEKDIFSLVINNVEIDDPDPDLEGERESTVEITVTVTYGKNHRVIFGIPDSYSCSFAIFKFQRTFSGSIPHSDWLIDRLQYYPPR